MIKESDPLIFNTRLRGNDNRFWLHPCYPPAIRAIIAFTSNNQPANNKQVTTMINSLKTGFLLLLTALTLVACTGHTYGDPDAQRDRSKEAQDEMRRDTR